MQAGDLDQMLDDLINLLALMTDTAEIQTNPGWEKEIQSIRNAPLAFYGAAARSLLLRCQRCGMCCFRNKHIALRPDDCRRMASHLHLGLGQFMRIYTSSHSDPSQAKKGAREIKKENGGESWCPFYDGQKKGCSIYQARPAVCQSYPSLTEDNLQSACHGRLITYAGCPAAVEVSMRISTLAKELDQNHDLKSRAEAFFQGADASAFFIMLYLHACRTVFGADQAKRKAKLLGLARLADEKELARPAELFLGLLFSPEGMPANGFSIRIDPDQGDHPLCRAQSIQGSLSS